MAPVCPCVNEPVWDLVMLRAGAPDGLTVVGSLAVAVPEAPPPEAAAELVTLAGALAATLTVSVSAGKLAPATSTVVLEQPSFSLDFPVSERENGVSSL